MPDNSDEFLAGLGISPEESDGDSTAIKALRKKVKEQSAKLAEYEKVDTQEKIKKAWDDLKVPEKYRKLYQGEETPESIKLWADAAKDLFDFSENAGNSGSEGEPTAQHQELQQFQAAAGIGTDPANVNLDSFKADAAKVKGTSATKNPEALGELLTKYGIRAGGATVPRTQ